MAMEADEEEEFEYSSEEGDVEWEDVDQGAEEAVVANGELCGPSAWGKAEAVDEPETPADADNVAHADLSRVDWGQVNAELNELETAASKKRKRTSRRRTKAEREAELVLHKSHLVVLLSIQLEWNSLCQSSLLRGLMLSLCSSAPVHSLCSDSNVTNGVYAMQLCLRWFTTEFTVLDCGHESLLTVTSLMDVVFEKKGSHACLALLFTTLCRALGFRARHACALDAYRVDNELEEAKTSSSMKRTRKRQHERRNGSSQSNSHLNSEDLTTASLHLSTGGIWTEVFDVSTREWIVVDGARKTVCKPLEYGELRRKEAPLSYIVSIDENGLLLDTTARYVARWSKTLQYRLADKWFELVLKECSRKAQKEDVQSTQGTTEMTGKPSVNELDFEEKVLKNLIEKEPMPTSVEGFRKHHLYCLERHLKQNECVNPRKPVGIFKGTPVFLRDDIQQLLPSWKWRRRGRIVTETSLKAPAKILVRNASGVDDTVDTTSRVFLYGEWQTEKFIPEPVIDGIVPKNKYGNIEIWSEEHVPRGATHVRLPRIAKVASELCLDYAPAVVGFDLKNGKYYPRIDGIVVATASVDLLLDSHAHLQQSAIEQAIKRNQSIIWRRWERLVKRALVRLRLEKDYGKLG